MLLARAGYKVLLVDKEIFPSDTINRHYLHQPAVARLKDWDLFDSLRASDCPPIRTCTMDLGLSVLRGSLRPLDIVAEPYAPRRTVLDKILVDAAVDAGAELRDSFLVVDLTVDGARVTGIRGRTKTGSLVYEHARMVIGADGQHSIVARLAKAAEYNVRPAYTCAYSSYWSGIPVQENEIYQRGDQMMGAYPTNDGLALVWIELPHSELRAFRTNIEKNFSHALRAVPQFADKIQSGRREERFVGTAASRNFFRKPYGAGWALVGDAGYHKDPITAQGIADAFRDAELAAEAIDAGISGRKHLVTALSEYEAKRNQAALAMYDLTCDFASMEPPSAEMEQLFVALANDRTETERFFSVLAGMTSITEFLAEENIRRIVENSAPRLKTAARVL